MRSLFWSVGLPALIYAGTPPVRDGMSIFWSDDFAGSSGSNVNTKKWTIAQAIDTNAEEQSYTTASRNLQLSGGGTVQFVPWKSATGGWTSGRIESVATWTPQAGKVMQIEASLRTGGNSAAQAKGMWPAVWMLGDSVHHGTQWPQCGEIDIFEMVNGVQTVYGTTHCAASACNEPTGLQGSTGTDAGWHTYAVKIDRTSNNWQTESISWMKDGATFFSITGAKVNDEGTWATLAHSPLYLIMNLAVGGTWPGDPNGGTLQGYGNMLEVEYAAVYTT